MQDTKDPVRVVIESFPAKQRDRELVFVEKFAGALAHFYKRKLENIRANPVEEDFPDIFAEEDGSAVGIEVLEIHDIGRRNRVLERQYTAALLSRLEGKPVPVPGLWITIRVQSPKGVPRLTSSRGHKLLDTTQRVLSEMLPTYASLQEGGAKRDRQIDPKTSASFDVLAWRIGGIGAQLDIKFSEEITKKAAEAVIAGPLTKKLRQYAQLARTPLYLLVVEWDRNIKTEDALTQAEKRASSISHPFQEIWHMTPYPNENFGFIHPIWPASLEKIPTNAPHD